MATTSGSHYCNVCERQHRTETAAERCLECKELLCSECKALHDLTNISKDHKTILLADFKNLPSFVLDIKNKCHDHKEKFEYYCSKHQSPCCALCTENHRECGTLTDIRNVKGIKSSPAVTDLEQNINDIYQAIGNILKDRQYSLENLKQNEENCRNKIKKTRLEINHHLDSLETELKSKLAATYVKHKTETENLIADLETRKVKIEKVHDDVNKIKQFASDIQLFLSLNKISDDIRVEESYVNSLTAEEGIVEVDISFLPSESLSVSNLLPSLGELMVTLKPSNITFTKQSEKRAQVSTVSDIDNIKVTKILEVTIPMKVERKVWISGCTKTSYGHIVLADNKNNLLIILRQNGSHVCDIPLAHTPNDCACLNDNIAVTSYMERTLTLLDINSKKVIREISFDGPCQRCGALAVSGNRLIVHFSGLEYQILDTNLELVDTIPVVRLSQYLSCRNDKIYCCDNDRNKVFCYDMKGNLKWEYHDDEILKGPHGLTSDNRGNVFVSSYGYLNSNSNIVVISADGSKGRVIIANHELSGQPYAINYNKRTNRLLVSFSSSPNITEFDIC